MRLSVIIFLCGILFISPVYSQGNVYIVLGSDTAIWEGMGLTQFRNTYRLGLYTDPDRNAYRVMDPAFREGISDSYGTTVKLTWWMMAGNIFRYATNTNVPLPNIMTLYLMKKYHMHAIEQFGDELSLHYHTFHWYDYSGDGRYWWNQSQTFNDCREDWDVTLAQFLLEEDIYPVTFRSGWHYMDNEWQALLDELLPFSMHNDWPAKRTDTEEPLDNIFDWSQAPSEFVPYRPSPENYQIPGDGRGWNVRSVFMGRVNQTMMDHIFEQAQQGIDQVAVFWAHLPELDFLDNISKINTLAHAAEAKYPGVRFRYTTGIEAMQRWLQTDDETPPELTLSEEPNGEDVAFIIQTDEPIFQTSPFVAIKNIYEDYFVVPAHQIGENTWRTSRTFRRTDLAKVGVVVTDTVGNLATEFIHYKPDDIFIDNNDAEYVEVSGTWSTSSDFSWGDDARYTVLSETETAAARWYPDSGYEGHHNIFVQVPETANPANRIVFSFYENGEVTDTTVFDKALPPNEWVYIGTPYFHEAGDQFIEMTSGGPGQGGKILYADVLKISALVRDRDLYIAEQRIDFGEVSQEDTVSYYITIGNRGIDELHIFDITSGTGVIDFDGNFPIAIDGMRSRCIPVRLYADEIGQVADTLYIHSNDTRRPAYPVYFTADVQMYFVVVDNDDPLGYYEFGNWHTSVAQAYGPSSRFSYLHEGPGAYARFTAILNKTGLYDLFDIVPQTVNSANRALYTVRMDDNIIDSLYIDQNAGSGVWRKLGTYYFPAGAPVHVIVKNTGESTEGAVLRADAIKIALVDEVTSVAAFGDGHLQSYRLMQNYPNPFNPETKIGFSVPEQSHVKIEIFNVLGQSVSMLVDGLHEAGYYEVAWRAQGASGTYIYRIEAVSKFDPGTRFIDIRRMVFLK
jgi:hypothetical protein